MIKIFRKKIHSFLVLSSTLIAFVSCDKDLSVSLDQNDDKLGVTTIDSMSVYASTVQLDHLPTHATGKVIVGKAEVPNLGSISASSYFRMALENYNNDFPEDAKFDSINLVLKLDTPRYFFGDTTSYQKLSVHRVNEEIKRTDISEDIGNYEIPVYVQEASIFSDKKFGYDPQPLGEYSFNPKVHSLNKLSIRLDDPFGEELFDQIQTNDHRVSDTESFQDYIKGFVVRPDASNTTIIGFTDSVEMHINYSYVGSDGFKTTGAKKIVMGSRGFQYNQIDYDRSGTDFEDLNTNNKELKSSETNGDVFIQSGSGLVAKIDIPSLREFMHKPGIAVNKAELIIETENDPRDPFAAPEALMLFVANSNNNPVSFVPYPFGGSNNIQNAEFISGNTTGKNGRYEFDLIEYIKTINAPENAEKSLMISAGTNRLFNATNTLRIAKENQTPKIKLNIVYTQFE